MIRSLFDHVAFVEGGLVGLSVPLCDQPIKNGLKQGKWMEQTAANERTSLAAWLITLLVMSFEDHIQCPRWPFPPLFVSSSWPFPPGVSSGVSF